MTEMTDTQALILALPSVLSVVASIVGIRMSIAQLEDLNMRISELRSHMDDRFDDMQTPGAPSCGRLKKS